jgi:putative transcriptional regulator
MSQNISNLVQEHRSKNNITQEELGQAVGVTRQTIIAIEKGNYTPSVLLALKIARYFNTTVNNLFIMET